MTYSQTGSVLGVLVAHDPDSLVSTPQERLTVTFEGVEGDRHAGITHRSNGRTPFYPRGTEIRNDRQVSLVSVEELAEVAATLHLPEIRPEWLGANLLLSGFPTLTLLPPATRLFFTGGVVLIISAENLPCSNPGKVLQAHYAGVTDLVSEFPRVALHKRGLVAVVERPGSLTAGEEVHIQIP